MGLSSFFGMPLDKEKVWTKTIVKSSVTMYDYIRSYAHIIAVKLAFMINSTFDITLQEINATKSRQIKIKIYS